MSLADFISQELRLRKPAKLLAMDAFSRGLASVYQSEHPDALVLEFEAPGIDLVLIGDTLNEQAKPAAINLLGRAIRLSPVVLAIAPENHPLGFNGFLSLGMRRLYGPDGGQYSVYLFDLNHYKPAPDWLNSRYWAHPERWEP